MTIILIYKRVRLNCLRILATIILYTYQRNNCKWITNSLWLHASYNVNDGFVAILLNFIQIIMMYYCWSLE